MRPKKLNSKRSSMRRCCPAFSRTLVIISSKLTVCYSGNFLKIFCKDDICNRHFLFFYDAITLHICFLHHESFFDYTFWRREGPWLFTIWWAGRSAGLFDTVPLIFDYPLVCREGTTWWVEKSAWLLWHCSFNYPLVCREGAGRWLPGGGKVNWALVTLFL